MSPSAEVKVVFPWCDIIPHLASHTRAQIFINIWLTVA